MRGLTTIVVSFVAAVSLAACGGSGSSTQPNSFSSSNRALSNAGVGKKPGNTNSPAVTGSIVNSPPSYDGRNPGAEGSECGVNGQVKNRYVYTVPGSTRTVQLPSGKFFGRLVLRHSTICQTAWGEVFFNEASKPPGYNAVHIVVIRPGGSIPKSIPFSTSDFASPIFSAMLENNSQSGCVKAEAWVVVGGKAGRHEVTNCSSS